MLQTLIRHLFNQIAPSLFWGWVGLHGRAHGRGHIDGQTADRHARQAKLIADHLALFGYSDLTRHRTRRLRRHGLFNRTAATTDRAAATVKQHHRDIAFIRQFDQRFLGLVLGPGGGYFAGILGRIRIANHHRLLGATVLGIPGVRPERFHDPRGAIEIGERLEQRHDGHIPGDPAFTQ